MVAGLDINEQEAQKTQKMAQQMGGQMILLPTDLTKDEQITSAVNQTAKLGTVKFLLNLTDNATYRVG